jgi:hypothetical protein
MACPYFVPEQKMQHASRPAPARSPLGALYRGLCQAAPDYSPSQDEMYDFCNFGYARGSCRQFPVEAEADAVRFTMHREQLLFILERDHAPVRHGRASDASGVLAIQAAAFSNHT